MLELYNTIATSLGFALSISLIFIGIIVTMYVYDRHEQKEYERENQNPTNNSDEILKLKKQLASANSRVHYYKNKSSK